MFRAVGLAGEGGTGDLSGVIGDLSDKVGLDAWAVEVEMLKANLGFADLEASILMVGWLITGSLCWYDVVVLLCLV